MTTEASLQSFDMNEYRRRGEEALELKRKELTVCQSTLETLETEVQDLERMLGANDKVGKRVRIRPTLVKVVMALDETRTPFTAVLAKVRETIPEAKEGSVSISLSRLCRETDGFCFDQDADQIWYAPPKTENKAAAVPPTKSSTKPPTKPPVKPAAKK